MNAAVSVAGSAPHPSRCRRLFAALDRRFAFRSRGNVVAAGVAVALLGGLLSLWLGQDANWDLRNYHLYNGYAALHGRLGMDLAPAQMQSYFNPLLDMLYYMLSVDLPAPLAGFAMGVLHAQAFLLLSGIVWKVLDPRLERARLVPWLALAGALLGLAMACKLTNVLFAFALGVAALVAGGRPRQRIGAAAVLTAVALVRFALLAGPWLLRVWQTFGNPLFPQFNSHFLTPLAQPVAVSDARWLPRTLWEWLTWSLQFSLAPNLVSEVRLRQIVWPLLYLLGLVALLRWVVRRPRRQWPKGVVAPAWRAVLVFVVVAFLAWQATFSIQRYLVVLELLAPLLLWVGLRWLLPDRVAAPVARWTLIACAAFALYGRGGLGA